MAKLQAHEVRCVQCGTLFTARRPDARTCSNKCRQAAHQAKHRPTTPVTAGANTSEVKRLQAEVERLRAELAKSTPVTARTNTSEAEIEDRILAALDEERADQSKRIVAAVAKARAKWKADLEDQVLMQMVALQGSVSNWMTLDEFKRVLGCLHPDREASLKRKNEAFQIFNRLKETVDPKTMIDTLRARGWEKHSSRYRPPAKPGR